MAVVFVLQVGLLLSVAALFHTYGGSLAHEVASQDSIGYQHLAESLLADHSYHLPGVAALETWRMPGYPFFIAVVFAVSNHSVYVLLVALALVGALASGLIYQIGRELALPRGWAFGIALLFGISPAVIWTPAAGMGDTTFTLIFLFALLLLVRFKRGEVTWREAGLFGLTLGLATLCRSVGFYLSLITIFSIPFFTNMPVVTRRTATLVGIALIAFYLPLLPWMARNEAFGGHFSLSSQFAFNPFYYNIPAFLAHEHGTAEGAERTALITSVTGMPWEEHSSDPYELVNGFTNYDRLATFDTQFLKDNFAPYTLFHLFKTIPFFVGSGVNVIYATITNEVPNMPDLPFFPRAAQNTANLFYGGSYGAVLQNLAYYWPATLERMLWLVLFALAFAAPFVTRGTQRRFAILGVVLILTVAILASPIAQPRYRIPAEPFIWVGAAMALYALRARYFAKIASL